MDTLALKYLKLSLNSDAKLSFDESKRLISYLGAVSPNSNFKLILSSQKQNLQLFLGVESRVVDLVKKRLYAINPNFIVTEVKKAEAVTTKPTQTLSFSFKKHYGYPLIDSAKAEDKALQEVLEHITQLEKREQLEIELTARPTMPLKVKLLQKRLLGGAKVRLSDPSLPAQALRITLAFLSGLMIGFKATLNLILDPAGSRSRQYPKNQEKIADPKTVMILDKLYEPLFKTSLDIRIKAPSLKKAQQLANVLSLSLNNFASSSGYQQFKYKNRQGLDIYSVSDLAALYHFEDIKDILGSSQSKVLPISKDLNQEVQPGDAIVGINSYKGVDSEIILPSKARQRHLYITGATGSGKSTLLASLALQDISSGQGMTLIDPHGDLAEDVMSRMPKKRVSDVIYFEPYNLDSSISLNLLEVKAAKGTKEYLLECDQITESVISLLRKVFDTEDISSHRLEYILRNSIHTCFYIGGSNIFTIFRLLTDPSFRLKVIPTIKDQNLANFWRNELGRAGEYQRVKMTAGLTSKIGRFLFSEPTKRVFGQSKSTLDIDQLMNQKKVLICNFSKGKLGEDGSKLFATAMLTKIQLAALHRAKVASSQRVEHYLYVDEFQNFSPSVLMQMLSEARKYKLYLTMAEQSPSQQDIRSTNIILANAGNLICFRAASPKDEQLLLPNFSGYLTSNDLNNLAAYNFYLRSITESSLAPTSGRTMPLAEPTKLASSAAELNEELSLQLATN